MKILFFSSVSPYSELFKNKSKIGGAEINLRYIAENLVKLNQESYYFSIKRGFRSSTKINGVRILHYPMRYVPKLHEYFPKIKNMNNSLINSQKRNKIEEIIKKNNIELIHTYSTYPDTYLAIKSSEKYNVPVIQRIAGRAWYNLLNEKPELLPYVKRSFEKVSMLLYISDYIKRQTKKYFEELEINVEIPNEVIDIGVDFNQINQINIEKLQKKYNINKNLKYIICVESFRLYSKRQDLLIESIPRLIKYDNNLRFLFVGEGTTQKKLIERVNELSINKYVIFLGNISHNDVMGLISSSEMVVHPTEFEGYSTVMRETLSLGKVFLGTDIEPINNFIENGVNGILIKNESNDIYDKVIEILNNKQLSEKIGKNAYNYARSEYDQKKNSNKYLKIFNSYKKD